MNTLLLPFVLSGHYFFPCLLFSVMVLGSTVDGTKEVNQDRETMSDGQREDGGVTVDEDPSVEVSDHAESPGSRRRSVRGKPRVPTAVDTSRLNKHLTNIWSSKRKKTPKKNVSSTPSLGLDDQQMESSGEMFDGVDTATAALDESAALNSQASTVIIVKTLPQKQAESYHSPPEAEKLPEDTSRLEVVKGSRDIAERLKARKQRLAASVGGSSIDASVNRSGQVTCELCAETVADYVQLVRHVCQQHEDCTYVRNYLDEIQPIADALSAVSLPCTACGRSFAGQAALASHRHECSAVVHVSKLGTHRKRVSASLLSPAEHAGDSGTPGQRNVATKVRRKSTPLGDGHDCAHCKRTFTSQDRLNKHVEHVHKQPRVKPSAGGRRGKPSVAKSAAASAGKPQILVNSVQPPVSGSTGSQFQRCDHCNAGFSRTSLLITHMRYCLKAGARS